MQFNKIFCAFREEALFIKEILGIGVTQLYKANYASKGMYYQTFTCLSVGIERLEKLCLILDYYISNQGKLPTENYIRGYSHKISELFDACREIAVQKEIEFHFLYDLNDEIQQAVIKVLSDFAESPGRYSNINVLVGKKENGKDCIEKWYDNVDLPIYEKHISSKRKNNIEEHACVIGTFLNEHSQIYYAAEDNSEVTDAIEAGRRTGIWEAVASYRQLYMLRLIRYLTELLRELEYKARKMGTEDIPFFGEIFGLFYNDDSYFRSRKTWDKL